jgi:endonuclease/exonuclease/phosphatase family metal-dependent hydrolase
MKKIMVLIGLIFCTIVHSQSIKMMTYNIRLDVASDGVNAWPLRKDFFASQIQFYEPDILGVQEAMPHQVIDLEQSLPQYSQVGVGREGEGKGESSNIFYKNSRLRVLTANTFWLSATPQEISKGWDAACHRVCTYALFQDIITKKIFWVFNTHLDHIGDQARTKGIALILSKIKELNTKNYPVFFMGDFNSEPQEDRIISLKTQMDDTRDIAIQKPFGPIGTFNNFEHNLSVTKRIDYIFVSKKANVVIQKYAVLSDSDALKYPSDHLPVFVEVVFNPNK